nr:MAG TPA: hypothetical protein [Caudoviricetes sp.]
MVVRNFRTTYNLKRREKENSNSVGDRTFKESV